jgi:hypothetical protein
MLLYSAKDEKFNNAVALKEYLEEKMKKTTILKQVKPSKLDRKSL